VSRLNEFVSTVDDLSGGIVGSISERRVRTRHLKRANNMIGRPYRAASVRTGSRDISSAVLGVEPHSLMKFYGTSPKLFVAGGAAIHEVQSADYPVQTLPFTPSSSEIWTHENLNGVLWATQRFGVQLPLFYDGTAWREMKLPKPAAAPTFVADSGGGSVDAGTHYYRVRWRYNNGSSLVGPVSAGRTVVGPNNTVNINANLVPGAPRGDYIGWTLERTKVGGSAVGPFYFVADGTAGAYADTAADADLFYIADEGLHGEPPHLDGMVGSGERLIGWAGSILYLSQAVGDAEATGLCNWDAELAVPVAKDDGDSIQSVLVVGDRLLILKKRSAHVLDGTDPESFVLTPIGSGAAEQGGEMGCVGPRAATAVGNTAYFFGDGGLFRFAGGRARPFGWVEIGHYKDEMNKALLDKIVLVNYFGDYLLIAYPVGAQTSNSEIIVYDLRFDNWWHWTNWRIVDAVVQKDGGFGDATLVFCDPKATEDVPAVGTQASFYAWADTRGAATQVYVQKLNTVGAPQWAANGIQVSACVGVPAEVDPLLVADGDDGCIVLWYDDRVAGAGPGYYIQRLNSAGAEVWTAGGIFLNAVGSQLDRHALVADGSGGAVVVVSSAGGSQPKLAWLVYADGFLSSFTLTTALNARIRPGQLVQNIPVADPFNPLYYACLTALSGPVVDDVVRFAPVDLSASVGVGADFKKMVSDLGGGVIVCWSFDAALGGPGDIYVQRLDSAGVRQWGPGGGLPLPVCTATGIQGGGEYDLQMVPDGAGGAIIVWADNRTADRAVYAQRVNNGTTRWTANGVPICSVPGADAGEHIAVVPDGAGGAIIVWNDNRNGNDDIFAQRVDANGAVQWAANGVAICAAAGRQYLVNAAADGLGGAMISWVDERAGAAADDVYAQRVNASGVVQWTANGVAVGAAANTQIGRGLAVDAAGATTLGYRVWAGLDGFLDERRADGTGGEAIPWYVESPYIDDGNPGLVKNLARLQLYVESDAADLLISLLLDPGGRGIEIPARITGAGQDWAEDSAVHPNDLEWDVGDWAPEGNTPVTVGLPQGSLAQRYSLRVSSGARAPVTFSGHEILGTKLPGRRMDR